MKKTNTVNTIDKKIDTLMMKNDKLAYLEELIDKYHKYTGNYSKSYVVDYLGCKVPPISFEEFIDKMNYVMDERIEQALKGIKTDLKPENLSIYSR